MHMQADDPAEARSEVAGPQTAKRLLHVGCGPKSPHRLHAVFRDERVWDEVRLDLDPKVVPDIICSTVDMRRLVASSSFDAVWSSHNLEHLFDHEVPLALSEFRRVLKPGGYLLLRCPDLLAIVSTIARSGLEQPAYISPAGPIAPLDMLFGHRPSIAQGNRFMAHHTGFSDARLGRLLLEAGFAEVMTKSASNYDLWAVAFAAAGTAQATLADLAAAGLDFNA
jgi:SAM-dependent methyltransferase